MKLTAYDVNKIGNLGGYKKTQNLLLIEEFVNSEMDCAKVEGWTHQTADSCANSFNQSIKRFNKSGIKCIVRNGEVFLVKITK